MSHQTVDLDGLRIEVFNTGLAALRWIKKNKEDCIVLARGRFYFQRKDGFEMTVRLSATSTPETSHVFSAANTVAGMIEKQLERAAA